MKNNSLLKKLSRSRKYPNIENYKFRKGKKIIPLVDRWIGVQYINNIFKLNFNIPRKCNKIIY